MSVSSCREHCKTERQLVVPLLLATFGAPLDRLETATKTWQIAVGTEYCRRSEGDRVTWFLLLSTSPMRFVRRRIQFPVPLPNNQSVFRPLVLVDDSTPASPR